MQQKIPDEADDTGDVNDLINADDTSDVDDFKLITHQIKQAETWFNTDLAPLNTLLFND